MNTLTFIKQYVGRNAFYRLLRKIRSAPEKFRSTYAQPWGRAISLCKKFCKIPNHLGGVRSQEFLCIKSIDENSSLEPLQLASCSRLKIRNPRNRRMYLDEAILSCSKNQDIRYDTRFLKVVRITFFPSLVSSHI